MHLKYLIISVLMITSFMNFAQERKPAVENSIIIETPNGVQSIHFLDHYKKQEASSSLPSLLALLAFIITPLGLYLMIKKQEMNKEQSKLQDNVILMADYQKLKKDLQADTDDDPDHKTAA